MSERDGKNPAATFSEALLELVRQAVREEVRAGIREVMNNHQKEDPVLDVKGAAGYLKYSENWIHRHWQKIGGRKAGREIRFFRSDLERWARGDNKLSRRGD
jgi:hypothetical protein